MSTDSNPRDTAPCAYYHELDNAAYEAALARALGCTPHAPLDGLVPLGDAPPPREATARFEAASRRLRAAFAGAAELGPPDVLHERWAAFSPAAVQIEFVLYRKPAYHAKHVVVEVSGGDIVRARVVGVLFQDQFALFPVVANGGAPPYASYGDAP
jgi:hypothetical protein